MSDQSIREHVQGLRKELAAIYTANAAHLAQQQRSQPDGFRHQKRLDRLQQIVEQLAMAAGRETINVSSARETFTVRFNVVNEVSGPTLAYSLAGPSASPTVSSQHYRSSVSLIDALSGIRLPGREIASGSYPERTYLVGAAQLEILNLTLPE